MASCLVTFTDGGPSGEEYPWFLRHHDQEIYVGVLV